MAVLPSHKNTLTYVEHCRIVMSDERLAYLKAEGAVERSFSLPYANSNILLLGPGTSITHQAARLLGDEGVCLAFVGGGGTPLYMTSVSEYRPTEYMQRWIKWWPDEQLRLSVAKSLQEQRVALIEKAWAARDLSSALGASCLNYRQSIAEAKDNTSLLLAEARFSKTLFAALSKHFGIQKFVRTPRAEDPINNYLDAGNYMAYGLAACALWILGVSFAFGVNHGMTRRGALVFDVADIVKDALVMPAAFYAASKKLSPSEARLEVLLSLERFEALKIMLDAVTKASKTP